VVIEGENLDVQSTAPQQSYGVVNHLGAERFFDSVDFLVNEKLALTPVSRKHLRESKKTLPNI